MKKDILKKVIPYSEPTTGLVFECDGYNTLALIKYKKKRGYKIYHPHEVLKKDYDELFQLSTEEKIDMLYELAGSGNFKIRGDLFSLLFDELLPEENSDFLTSDIF